MLDHRGRIHQGSNKHHPPLQGSQTGCKRTHVVLWCDNREARTHHSVGRTYWTLSSDHQVCNLCAHCAQTQRWSSSGLADHNETFWWLTWDGNSESDDVYPIEISNKKGNSIISNLATARWCYQNQNTSKYSVEKEITVAHNFISLTFSIIQHIITILTLDCTLNNGINSFTYTVTIHQ